MSLHTNSYSRPLPRDHFVFIDSNCWGKWQPASLFLHGYYTKQPSLVSRHAVRSQFHHIASPILHFFHATEVLCEWGCCWNWRSELKLPFSISDHLRHLKDCKNPHHGATMSSIETSATWPLLDIYLNNTLTKVKIGKLSYKKYWLFVLKKKILHAFLLFSS